MKSTITILALAIVASVAGCKKDDTPPNGGGGGGTPNYMPMTAGNTWTYNGGTDYTLTMTTQDSVNGGKTYRVANHSTAGLKVFRKEGSSYFTFLDTGDFLLLKDDAAAGTKWTINAMLSGFNARFEFEITSVEGTKVINGATYSKVITVAQDLKVDWMNNGTYIPTDLGNVFYADKIGMISTEMTSATSLLLSYTVN